MAKTDIEEVLAAAAVLDIAEVQLFRKAYRKWFGSRIGEDLLDKHWLDGLYVSIVPASPTGTKLNHTVEGTGNVLHAGVWTGRYLAGRMLKRVASLMSLTPTPASKPINTMLTFRS